MNSDFPPLSLAAPQVVDRRPERRPPIPLSTEILARRTEIARALGVKVEGLNKFLRGLSADERRAVFFKVTHDGPVDLGGTGLKPLAIRSDKVTLAIPRGDNLDALAAKITEFETATPDRNGVVKHQNLVVPIESIERGDPMDRLSDELLAEYESLVSQPNVICEVEILSVLENGVRKQRERIAEILRELNNAFASGVHGTLFEHDTRDCICRAVMRCTGPMFRKLVEEDFWQTRISWFEPKPRFETFHMTLDQFNFARLHPIKSPPNDAPVICIMDSGVTPGNPFLAPVTKPELLKSFLTTDSEPFDAVGHGSGVASIASYYALTLADEAENTPKAWIAGARILDETNQIEDRLFSKLIEEVVVEFKPHGVRIFNLSVADIGKKWNQETKRTQPRNSWTARTIDRLSREHDVVFVVAAGNIPSVNVRELLRSGKDYPLYLRDEDCRLLDPSQSALAITVGSIAPPSSLVVQSPDTVIAQDYQPSPFTRSGPGIKGETKPDVVEVGGNFVRDVDLNWVRSNPGTNVMMASNKLTPAVAHNHGTSFAAPRVAHTLAVALHELNQLGIGHVSAPLLKAFLVNSCSYRGNYTEVMDSLGESGRKKWLDILGHGIPDATRTTGCDDYSTVLFYQGDLEPNKVAFFDVPVPSSLTESNSTKRITVTLAHYPEVQKWGLESYFGADLKWRMFRGNVERQSIIDIMSTETEATESEDESASSDQVKELQFDHKLTRRSRGAVQHDIHEWTRHYEEFSANHYTLAVGAYKRWNRAKEPVPFGLVIRIEDCKANVQIYQQIKQAVEVLVRQQARV